MANYLDLNGLQHYDSKIKELIGANLFAAFSTAKTYTAGSIVTKDGKVYSNNAAFGPADWDASKWTQVSVETVLTALETALNAKIDAKFQTASYDFSTETISFWKSADTTGTADFTFSISGKADKVLNATANNFAGLDANGNLIDSSYKAADFVAVAQGTEHNGKLLKVGADGNVTLGSPEAAPEYTIVKAATAEAGYFATYELQKDSVQVGAKINIPKDYLVKSGEVKTCTTPDVPEIGYLVGDKYLDFIVNVKEGTATDEHIYILVKDLVDVYTAGVGIDISNTNEISVKLATNKGLEFIGTNSDELAVKIQSSTDITLSADGSGLKAVLTEDAKKAENITIADEDGKFTATNVEDALAELADKEPGTISNSAIDALFS